MDRFSRVGALRSRRRRTRDRSARGAEGLALRHLPDEREAAQPAVARRCHLAPLQPLHAQSEPRGSRPGYGDALARAPDDPAVAAFRAEYTNMPNAQRPPFVLLGDTFASDYYWHGTIMTTFAEDWVRLWTHGKGVFATAPRWRTPVFSTPSTASTRCIASTATASSCCAPVATTRWSAPGHDAVESVSAPYVGKNLALESAYLVGSTVVNNLVTNWSTTRDHIPGDSLSNSSHSSYLRRPLIEAAEFHALDYRPVRPPSRGTRARQSLPPACSGSHKSRSSRRKRNGLRAMLTRQFQRAPITSGKLLRLAATTAIPHRPYCMKDPFRRKTESQHHLGIARRASMQRTTRGQQLGSGRAMNRAIHAAAARALHSQSRPPQAA